MEGKRTTVEGRIRKSHCIKKKKKLQVLRKVKNQKCYMKSNSTMKSATLAEAASYNKEEDNEDSLDNQTLVNENGDASYNQEEDNEDSLDNKTLVNENGDASFGSSPICIEMRGEKKVPSTLFNESVSRYQMNVAKRVVCENEYSVWMQSNFSSRDEWNVQLFQSVTSSNFLKYKKNISGIDEQGTSGDKFSKENNVWNLENMDPDKISFRLIKISRDSILLVLPPGQSVCFLGLLKLKVLLGSVEVMGSEITPRQGTSIVSSPWNHSMLGICANEYFDYQEEQYYYQLEADVLPKLSGKLLEKSLKTVPLFSSFILLGREQSVLPLLLNKHFPDCFGDVKSQKSGNFSLELNATFFNPKSLVQGGTFTAERIWYSTAKKIFTAHRELRIGSPRVMVCGGKSVGKSSFLRFLINRVFNKPSTKEILYIDLDPGQCEFTPPGCVSAVIVKKPLLGPSFTHFIDPERCVFIGRVNVGSCPSWYLECVEHILNWCSSNPSVKNIPWFINTMGFAKGVGVDLTIALIKMICPTDLIQIKSNFAVNFPFELTYPCVNDMSVELSRSVRHKYVKYQFLPLLSEIQHQSNRPSSHLREIAVLAYFSKCVLGAQLSLLGSKVHKWPFCALKLCICHQKVNYSYYLSAMNANVVALCNVGEYHGLSPTDKSYPEICTKPPINDCYGMGIVRGVDRDQKMVFITSPLPLIILKKVNCLMLGEVYLPESVYTCQKEKGYIPYVVVGHCSSFSSNLPKLS